MSRHWCTKIGAGIAPNRMAGAFAHLLAPFARRCAWSTAADSSRRLLRCATATALIGQGRPCCWPGPGRQASDPGRDAGHDRHPTDDQNEPRGRGDGKGEYDKSDAYRDVDQRAVAAAREKEHGQLLCLRMLFRVDAVSDHRRGVHTPAEWLKPEKTSPPRVRAKLASILLRSPHFLSLSC